MGPKGVVSLLLLYASTISARPSLYYSYPSYYDDLLSTSYQSGLLHNVKSQFHTQDELGQYSYGYNDGVSSKIESRSADGTTQGSYSYIDSNGIVQNVNYQADDVNGFRVSGSNLPMAPAVPIASSVPIAPSMLVAPSMSEQIISSYLAPETENLEIKDSVYASDSTSNSKLLEKATHRPVEISTEKVTEQPLKKANSSMPTIQKINPIFPKTLPIAPAVMTPKVNYAPYTPQFSPYQFYSHHDYSVPSILPTYRYSHVPSIGPIYSQYHSQDELGQYSYGYSGGPSSKAEVKTLDGVTRGGYSYVDPNGIIQKVSYIADPINGFRVSGTNLPYPNYPTYLSASEYHPLHEINLNHIDIDQSNNSD